MLILPETHFSPACGKPLMVSSKDIDQYVFFSLKFISENTK